MKGTKKKLLGLLGLFLVAAMTTFAALMPQPGVSAKSMSTTYNQTTDTIEVTVLEGEPRVSFKDPKSGLTVTDPDTVVHFEVNYEQIDKIWVEVEYTDLNGNKQVFRPFAEAELGQEPGTWWGDLDLSRYGYGHYVIHVYGDRGGVERITEDAIEVTYTAQLVPVPDTGEMTRNVGPSRADYLITGIIVAALVAGTGIFMVLKFSARKAKAKRRR